MSIASIFYNTVGKRTSTLVLTIVGGALVFERGFDSLCKYFGGVWWRGGGCLVVSTTVFYSRSIKFFYFLTIAESDLGKPNRYGAKSETLV
jgi:hypothetical protein